MTTETLLSWHYLVFWLPMMASALLMLITTLRFGHHHGVRHGGVHGSHGHMANAGGHLRVAGDGGGHSHQPGSTQQHSTTASSHHALGQATRIAGRNIEGAQIAASHNQAPGSALLGIIGVGRAPLPIVLQSFFLMWGFFGFWANRLFVHSPNPSIFHVLPSLGIALVAGALGARGAAELVARILPPDESAVLSREGLFGLTGKITFPASETSGRIFVYDEYGTLHDEGCRVETGHPAIEKGRSAIVLDIDEKGNLIVKEIA